MPNYNIVTDSCCDLRPETYEQLNLTVVPLSMEFRGQVREDKATTALRKFTRLCAPVRVLRPPQSTRTAG